MLNKYYHRLFLRGKGGGVCRSLTRKSPWFVSISDLFQFQVWSNLWFVEIFNLSQFMICSYFQFIPNSDLFQILIFFSNFWFVAIRSTSYARLIYTFNYNFSGCLNAWMFVEAMQNKVGVGSPTKSLQQNYAKTL